MAHQNERIPNHCVTGKIIQGNVASTYIILKQQYILLITFEAGRIEISDSSALLLDILCKSTALHTIESVLLIKLYFSNVEIYI